MPKKNKKLKNYKKKFFKGKNKDKENDIFKYKYYFVLDLFIFKIFSQLCGTIQKKILSPANYILQIV